ncbi:MAG: preprotein translocase subunit SecA [Bacteroidia bacterium]|nr:preprotein translocase subunit SecA [Bacteroidia bacterium]
MLKFLTKLFGDKKGKDLKELSPFVDKINAEFGKLAQASDDDLRAKTADFKARISQTLSEVNSSINELSRKANLERDIQQKEELFNQIDKLKEKRDEQVEQVLMELLPEAFAVVKSTAKRLSENKQLRVKATDWDRKIAGEKQNVSIDGDWAIWSNTWMAAGGEIEWNMVHYDVQLIGGVVLHQGKIAEMATGEGKTLVATLPVYLNALAGLGVHVVTVNNYLARRDAEWNAPLFEFHGLTVDCIDLHEPNSDERRAAYNADITYGTNNEFGFDYLRDNMVTNAGYLVQRKHHYAIIDEIDSVLIDEARTPLIISGPVPKGDIHEFHQLKPRIERLIKAQRQLANDFLAEAKKNINSENKEEAHNAATALFRVHRGLPRHSALIKFLSEPGMKSALQKIESYYMQDKSKNMHIADDALYFVIDDKNNQVELTDKGRDLITEHGEDENLFVIPDVAGALIEIDNNKDLSERENLLKKDELSREFAEKSERLHTINQLVKAYALFEKDVEYIVDEGKVKIVDEQTGRVLAGRRYSDGLHQAIEAKENVKVEAATQTFATVTLQNYFRMYHKLSGMTGTAETEAAEFYEIYKLDVTVIPTNRPIVRDDREDLVYKTKREKYNAVIDEIETLVNQEKRPVLVGTTSVEVSELLSRMLRMKKIEHNVLNAKRHQQEAEVVAAAGKAGTVTIATNMAGRGTDIKLGEGVIPSGGLAIIGTERHESRRVDRQLRGRAGRQGDPGSSQFFVSLEDDLMRLFGSERIARIMDRLGIKEGEVIQHSMITKSITNAQKKVEENNFSQRKRLLEYDDVMNSQREVVYRRRRNALFGDRFRIDLDNMLADLCENITSNHYPFLDAEGMRMESLRLLALDPKVTDEEMGNLRQDEIATKLFQNAQQYFDRKRRLFAETTLQGLLNIREKRPEVELVRIDFTDGHKVIPVVLELDAAIESQGEDVPRALEKTIMLAVVDEKWKNHLREMDELRTSVQNAVFEQKDPLLVYKFESYELFKKMLDDVNREVISTILKSSIQVGDQESAKASGQQDVKRDDFSKLKARHDALEQARREETAAMATNRGEQEERPVSRRERREMDRRKKR